MNNQYYLFKELEIIQRIISRMANNSFLLRGWTVLIIVGTLILKGDKFQALIAFIPLFAFWHLDAYFLRQERLFRKLYQWVINNRLKTDEHLFNLDTSRFENEVDGLFRTMFWKEKNKKTPTLLIFYGSIMLLIIIYSLILFWINN